MLHYSVTIAWSDEDAGYVGRVPAFPNLFAFGETQEEALAEAKFALQSYIEIYRQKGMSLPAPDYERDKGAWRVGAQGQAQDN